MLLVRPEGSSLVTQGLVDTLAALANESGLALNFTDGLLPAKITAATRRVVVESGTPRLEELAADNPQAQFLVIEAGGVVLLQPGAFPVDDPFEAKRSFAAGYAASLLAPEARIGAVLPAALPSAGEGFFQGGVYACGLCNPPYPPYADYPLTTVSTSDEESLAALEGLAVQGVSTVYLGRGIASQEVALAASDLGMLIVGAEPPPPGASDTWAATISADLPAALRQAWGDDGASPANWVAPLQMEYVDPDLFSPGRQDDLVRLIDRLESGAVRVLLD
ncbi:MAG: hypothetical protein MUO23_02780 [Anaerolineales bacterium]|nr:hypothetical protein [Anaerolineales bacterium]